MAPVKAPTPDQIKNWLHIKRVKPEKGKFKSAGGGGEDDFGYLALEDKAKIEIEFSDGKIETDTFRKGGGLEKDRTRVMIWESDAPIK